MLSHVHTPANGCMIVTDKKGTNLTTEDVTFNQANYQDHLAFLTLYGVAWYGKMVQLVYLSFFNSSSVDPASTSSSISSE
jgi:hypothetical protein